MHIHVCVICMQAYIVMDQGDLGEIPDIIGKFTT